MAVANNAIRQMWRYDDGSGVPKTGMVDVTDCTIVLHRETSSGFVAATETVTFTEIGVTGYYTLDFVPENSGLYVLELEELNADSNFRHPRWDFQVYSAGTAFAPSLANAFCSEADIERWTQAAITSSTRPSDTEAAAFAESRAAVLMSLCASWGFSVTPATVTSGSIIEDLLREANAIGAALDFTVAQTLGKAPSKSDRAAALEMLWLDYVGGSLSKKLGYLEIEVTGTIVGSFSTDHILSGDTIAYNEGSAPTSAPIGVGMRDAY